MNIKQAKAQIRHAVTAYRTKNIYGRPMIAQNRQRPIFLVGAPGIGKTAIVEQIAQEMGVALVSYSITHHTRQSALGLPFIREKEYDGRTYRVSEYTMSEIVASCYEKMEQTGLKEGILFLDEVNCVSETLMPAMLQFLQYKSLGQHKVPEGWLIVTAGNPPEYNQSVREFDMVTSDRLKRIDVEPDYEVWREWAQNAGIHACILSYLHIRQDHFYHVQATVDGRELVTPRGWVDLSDMILLYELNGIEVDELLVRQYLQCGEIARQFAVYYQMWNRYAKEYQVQEILDGNVSETALKRAAEAAFDERVTLVSLLLDALDGEFKRIMTRRLCLEDAREVLNQLKDEKKDVLEVLTDACQKERRAISDERKELLSEKETERKCGLIRYLEQMTEQGTEAFADKAAETEGREAAAEQSLPGFMRSAVRAYYSADIRALAADAKKAGEQLEHMLAFCETAFGNGPELLLAVTMLTSSEAAAKFIARYGSPAYYRHNKELLFYERKMNILKEIDELDELDE